jgi:hypothetical protein
LTDTSHCQEYVLVPVEGIVPETVRAWFTSNAVALTVGATGATRAVLTVIVADAADVADSVVDAESVIPSLKA